MAARIGARTYARAFHDNDINSEIQPELTVDNLIGSGPVPPSCWVFLLTPLTGTELRVAHVDTAAAVDDATVETERKGVVWSLDLLRIRGDLRITQVLADLSAASDTTIRP